MNKFVYNRSIIVIADRKEIPMNLKKGIALALTAAALLAFTGCAQMEQHRMVNTKLA